LKLSRLERYVARGREAFEADELIQNWFIRHLQIIGEAAQGLPKELQMKAPQVPWSKIIGMRHILVHGYFDIDNDVVWQAVIHDLPEPTREIQQILDTL
jgi:uncharacterized protein with HEPN domain